MSTLVTPPAAPAVQPLQLRERTLPAWAPWALAVPVLAATALLFAVTGLAGRAGFALVAALLYLVALMLLSRWYENSRRATDRIATSLIYASFLVALAPLVTVLGTTLVRGLKRLDGYFLLHSMRNVGPRDDAGGAYHAIVGTIEQVGIASLIAVPIGILTAIYLVEYGRGALATAVTFFVDVMTGVPSIVSGLFIFTLWILTLGNGFSGFAGALALSILMLPVVVRSTEEMLKLVPNELREASYALGVPRWRTILKVVLPTATTGIVTGVMLAVARITGETAPLLLTAFFTDSINVNPFQGPQVALPLYVYNEAFKGLDIATDRAWAGALTLIVIVMLLSLVARVVARFSSVKR